MPTPQHCHRERISPGRDGGLRTSRSNNPLHASQASRKLLLWIPTVLRSTRQINTSAAELRTRLQSPAVARLFSIRPTPSAAIHQGTTNTKSSAPIAIVAAASSRSRAKWSARAGSKQAVRPGEQWSMHEAAHSPAP